MSTTSITRRTLLTVGSVGSLGVLAGCGGASVTAPSTGPSASGTRATGPAASGGTITIALDREIPTIDPKENLIGQQPVLILSNAVYEPLMTSAAGGTVAPVGAESFEADAKGSVWTLTLKEGLTFSNGDPLTSAEVVAHVKRMSDPTIGASSAAQAAQITKMTAPDERTVVFTLTAPNADFAELFARQLGMIGHPSVVDDFGFPIGAGPYVVTGFQAANQIELTRSDSYAGDPGLADTLIYRMIPDADSRLQSLKAGDIDLMWTEVAQHMSEARTSGLGVHVAPAAVSSMMFNFSVGPLSDAAIRTGIAQAIDRDALNAVVNLGEGFTVDNPYSLLGDLAPTVKYPAFDEAAARAALEGKNLTLSMVVGNSPDTMQRAAAVQDMLAKVGVTIEVKPIESASFVSTLDAGDFDVADLVTSVFGDPTGAQLVFSSEGPYNFGSYANDTVDTEIAAASATTDTAQRAEHIQAVADQLTTDMPVAWYTASNAGVVVRNGVAGVPDVSDLTLVSINPKTIGRAA